MHTSTEISTPIVPPVTILLVHSKSTTQKTCSIHGKDGWYIGPSLEHFLCVKCYAPLTNDIQDVDTVKFFPDRIPFPYIIPEDYFNQSATYIIDILKSTPSVVPSLEYCDRTKNTLVKIAELLGQATKKTSIVLTVATPTPYLTHISLPVQD